jgi:hypothetical protein
VRDADRTVIAGDAVITTKQESTYSVLVQQPMVRRPPAYATTDWQLARLSVERIAALEPELLATGHGIPMRGAEMRDQLETLAREFARLGIPPRGRYVWMPATADEHGPIDVPPPVSTPAFRYAAVAAVAIVAGLAVRAWINRDDEPTDDLLDEERLALEQGVELHA